MNLTGDFNENSGQYYNQEGQLFGIVPQYSCAVYYHVLFKENAYSFNQIIASRYVDKDVVILYTESQTVYLRLKKMDFKEFLKENTENGNLKSLLEIRLKGKKPSMYSKFTLLPKGKSKLNKQHRLNI